MTDLKAANSLGIDLGGIDPANHRRGRAVAKPLNQLLNRGFFARQMCFDASVGAISDPSRDAELIGLLLCPCAEEDPLNAAGNANVTADASHHTTLMSGASSAFMPTTL